MEMGLRIVLLLVAFVIVAGIVWDTFRSRRKPAIKKARGYRVDRLDEKKATEPKKSKTKLDKKGFVRNRNEKLDYSKDKDKAAHFKIHSEDLNFDSEMDVLPNDEMVVVKTHSNASPNKANASSKTSFPSLASPFTRQNSKNALNGFSEDNLISDDIELDLEEIQAHEPLSSHQRDLFEANPTLELNAEPTAQRQELDTVFVLNVMAKQPGIFLGKKLIDIFDDVHLFYGDMHIFHRYENADGSGKHMFSLASAIEPGIFELETLESYLTPGLTLFFSPTTRNHSIAAFELMLRTAKMLATALDGEIKDQSRRPLTLEGIERYRKNVRESVKLHRASSSLERGNG